MGSVFLGALRVYNRSRVGFSCLHQLREKLVQKPIAS
jgi:hypothetical protein